jgi:hypothetical protein
VIKNESPYKEQVDNPAQKRSTVSEDKEYVYVGYIHSEIIKLELSKELYGLDECS